MRTLAIAALAALLAGCARRAGPDPAAVRPVRQAEAALGYEPTRNFHRAGGRQAYYLCYAAGRFELPADYRGLRMDSGRSGACRFDPRKLDVLRYPAEALAGRAAPVTRSLAAAQTQRRDFVVAHEDFHEQPGVRALEPALKEAASTLAGLLTSAEAARLRDDAEAADRALRETDLFLAKARRINAVHAELRKLYAHHARGELSAAETLAAKAAAFDSLRRSCAAEAETPRAFHPCPAALNNAGLAFDATYTREYPRVHAIFEESGRDVAATIAALRALALEPSASN